MIRRRQASWPAWQKTRVRQLRDDGCELDLALRLASAETSTRQKLGRSIGWEAARDAQLMLLEDGDTFRFALTGSFRSLSTERKQRLLKMPHVSEIITADQFSDLRFR